MYKDFSTFLEYFLVVFFATGLTSVSSALTAFFVVLFVVLASSFTSSAFLVTLFDVLLAVVLFVARVFLVLPSVASTSAFAAFAVAVLLSVVGVSLAKPLSCAIVSFTSVEFPNTSLDLFVITITSSNFNTYLITYYYQKLLYHTFYNMLKINMIKIA